MSLHPARAATHLFTRERTHSLSLHSVSIFPFHPLSRSLSASSHQLTGPPVQKKKLTGPPASGAGAPRRCQAPQEGSPEHGCRAGRGIASVRPSAGGGGRRSKEPPRGGDWDASGEEVIGAREGRSSPRRRGRGSRRPLAPPLAGGARPRHGATTGEEANAMGLETELGSAGERGWSWIGR
jgi:hypothetical protein